MKSPGLPAIMAVLLAVASYPAIAQDAPPPSAREAELEMRLRKMEESNRNLADQMQDMMREVKTLRAGSGSVEAKPLAGGARPSPGASSSSGRDPAAPSYTGISGTKSAVQTPLQADFGPGFQLESDNGEYQLQIHQETQVDYRAFNPNGEELARDGFVIPRVRLFLNGRATKSFDYMFSINRGFGALDVLDAWVNFHPSDKFQIKVGRFMTPFNYEQFAVQNMWLITPERSIFTGNLGLNRQIGAMVWGQVADQRVDYAVGVFDGPRNSFEDFNNAKDVMSYLNIRPFQKNDDSILRDLNLGGSMTYGSQDNPLVPRAFRTAANASNAGTANRYAPPFLVFGDDVVERGQRSFWSANVAYFYKHLSVLADYNGGILRYAKNKNAPASVDMPVSGFSVAAGYFLTGETVQRRTIVDPKRPFNLKKGAFALGAIELAARYSTFDIDNSVFTGKLADPSLWSNRAWATNAGVNWYLNRYVKIYLDWQHSEFGNPVLYATPGKKALTNEMLWLRFQFYF